MGKILTRENDAHIQIWDSVSTFEITSEKLDHFCSLQVSKPFQTQSLTHQIKENMVVEIDGYAREGKRIHAVVVNVVKDANEDTLVTIIFGTRHIFYIIETPGKNVRNKRQIFQNPVRPLAQ
jgi:transcriptional regulator